MKFWESNLYEATGDTGDITDVWHQLGWGVESSLSPLDRLYLPSHWTIVRQRGGEAPNAQTGDGRVENLWEMTRLVFRC